jgi:hypothetical protein
VTRQPVCQPLGSVQSHRSAGENSLWSLPTMLGGIGNGLRARLEADKSQPLPARWLELLKALDEAGGRRRQPLPGNTAQKLSPRD